MPRRSASRPSKKTDDDHIIGVPAVRGDGFAFGVKSTRRCDPRGRDFELEVAGLSFGLAAGCFFGERFAPFRRTARDHVVKFGVRAAVLAVSGARVCVRLGSSFGHGSSPSIKVRADQVFQVPGRLAAWAAAAKVSRWAQVASTENCQKQ